MGSVVNSLFGGGSSGSSTDNSSQISGLDTIAGGQVDLSNQVNNAAQALSSQGQNIYNPAYSQYLSGLTGTLTPAQQALVTSNLGTANAGTEAAYGNLGLGGSTMQGQDLASNELKSLAEQSNINFDNEKLGLSGLQTADQYYNTAGNYYNTASNALSGASTSVNDAGRLISSNLSELNSQLNSLFGSNSSGSNLLSSLFGGSTSGASSASGGGLLSSLFGSGTGTGVVDSGTFDISGLAAAAA